VLGGIIAMLRVCVFFEGGSHNWLTIRRAGVRYKNMKIAGMTTSFMRFGKAKISLSSSL
jgi:hypothetical protein